MMMRNEHSARGLAKVSLVAALGVVLAAGIGDLTGDVMQRGTDRSSPAMCRSDWNDSLLDGVRVGSPAQWESVLRGCPELLVKVCSEDARATQ